MKIVFDEYTKEETPNTPFDELMKQTYYKIKLINADMATYDWLDLVDAFWQDGWELRVNDFKHTNGGRVIGFEEAIVYWLTEDKPTASPPPF